MAAVTNYSDQSWLSSLIFKIFLRSNTQTIFIISTDRIAVEESLLRFYSRRYISR